MLCLIFHMEILYFAHSENCFSFIYGICCKQK